MKFKEIYEAKVRGLVEPSINDIIIRFDKEDNPDTGKVVSYTDNTFTVSFKKGRAIYKTTDVIFKNSIRKNGKTINTYHVMSPEEKKDINKKFGLKK